MRPKSTPYDEEKISEMKKNGCAALPGFCFFSSTLN